MEENFLNRKPSYDRLLYIEYLYQKIDYKNVHFSVQEVLRVLKDVRVNMNQIKKKWSRW